MAQALEATVRDHPRGEAGVRRSLEEVANQIARDRLDPEVRAWAIKALFDAGDPKGPKARGEAILAALQKELIWVPDPLDAEYIVRAGRMIGKDKKFWGGDCDDKCVALGAALASVGIKVLVDGVGYSPRDPPGSISHVLLWMHDNKRWLYVDPSTSHPVGVADKPARERILNIWGEVLCDSSNCMLDGKNISPDVVYKKGEGQYVGVSGPPGLGDYLAGLDAGSLGTFFPLTTTPPPPDFSEKSLEDYATQYGRDVALQAIKNEIGIDVSKCVSGSSVDWKCAAGKVTEYYAGIDPGYMFNDDGSINWEGTFVETSGIAAAAACTAYGGAAVAPLCAAAGKLVGQAFYDSANAIIAAFGTSDPPTATVQQFTAALFRWMWGDPHEKARVFALMTLRLLGSSTFAAMLKLNQIWLKARGTGLTYEALEAKLVAHGWVRPNDWRKAGGQSISGAGGCPGGLPPPVQPGWQVLYESVFDVAYGIFAGTYASGSTDFDQYYGNFSWGSDRQYVLRLWQGGQVTYGGVFFYVKEPCPPDYNYSFGSDSGTPYHVYSDPALDQLLDQLATGNALASMKAAWMDSLGKAIRGVTAEATYKTVSEAGLGVKAAPPKRGLSTFEWLAVLAGVGGVAYGGYRYGKRRGWV